MSQHVIHVIVGWLDDKSTVVEEGEGNMKKYDFLDVVGQENGYYYVQEGIWKPILFKSKKAHEALQWAIDHIQTEVLKKVKKI